MKKEAEFMPTRQEMIDLLTECIRGIERTEMVELVSACDRISAEEIRADYSLPNAPAAGCDGIGVRFRDFAAGIPDTSGWKEGSEYCYANTGVALAEGYDTVIPIEEVVTDSGELRIITLPRMQGEEVIAIGASLLCGEVLLQKNERITPSHIGILASAGLRAVRVYQKPVVSFLPTGNELVQSGGLVAPGKNVESNGTMLSAYLRAWGANPILYPVIPDETESIRKALKDATASSDLVLICGGSSKGTDDLTMDILESLGEVLVYELGHGPGKHCSFAFLDDVPVIGLPGPPGGTELTGKLYVQGAVKLLGHQPYPYGHSIKAKLTEKINGLGIDFIRTAKLFCTDGAYYVTPIPMRSGTRRDQQLAANARIYCKKMADYEEGEEVWVEPDGFGGPEQWIGEA